MEAEGTQHREIESRFSILRGELLNGRYIKDVINSLPPTKRRN